MALYPPATKKLIPPGANDPAIIVCGAILHVASGTSSSLYPYFNGPSGGIESHFYIRDDGTTEQYRDTKYEADANLHANSFRGGDGKLYGYVSIETWGLDNGTWNPAMLAEIKRLLTWLSTTHKFPLHKCATPTDPGVGYHVMFGAPGPWTPVAKTCPGPNRIKQFNDVLVPWFRTANTPAPPSGQEDDDMTVDEYEDYNGRLYGTTGTLGVWHAQEVAHRKAVLDAMKAQTDAINALATALSGALTKPNA